MKLFSDYTMNTVVEDILDDLPLSLSSDLDFHHYDAPPPYDRQVIRYLNKKFSDKWIDVDQYETWTIKTNKDSLLTMELQNSITLTSLRSSTPLFFRTSTFS